MKAHCDFHIHMGYTNSCTECLHRENDRLCDEVKEYREALRFYAFPDCINATQHANGGINIWEGGGTDTLGTVARKVFAKYSDELDMLTENNLKTLSKKLTSYNSSTDEH